MIRLAASVGALSCALAVGATATVSALAPESAVAKPKAEWDQGKEPFIPPDARRSWLENPLPCVTHRIKIKGVRRKIPASKACFDRKREEIWVLDLLKDGHSAIAVWYLNNSRRTGVCRNRAGVHKWASCNKSFKFRTRHRFRWRAALSEKNEILLRFGSSDAAGKEWVR